MNTELTNQMDAVVAKMHFCYNNKNVIIDKYKVVNGTNVVVWIDDKPKNLLINEVAGFLDSLFEPINLDNKQSNVPTVHVAKELMSFQPTKENETIKVALLDALKKVKDDPKYIEQANSICNITSQMINLQKEEIKMLQLLKRAN